MIFLAQLGEALRTFSKLLTNSAEFPVRKRGDG